MGMIANLLRVEEELLEKFIASSDLLEEYIFTEHKEWSNASNFSSDEIKNRDQNEISLGKSWDAISYLLGNKKFVGETNTPDLLQLIIFNDQIFDPEQDLGYGPGMYLTPSQVYKVNVELSLINENKILHPEEYLDGRGIGIYVIDFNRKGDLEYILHYFKILKIFYKEAAKNKQAIILYIG